MRDRGLVKGPLARESKEPGGLSQCNHADITACLCQRCSGCLCQLHASTSTLTRPSLWSAIVQESMKVCAMTRSTASTLSDVCTSKTNWGFLMMLIQNRRGRLQRRWKRDSLSAKKAAVWCWRIFCTCYWSYWSPPSKTSFPLCFAALHSHFAAPQQTKVALSARGSSNQMSSASLGAHRAPYLFVFQIWMVSGSAIP